jgi:hypothetical protein
VTNTSPQTAVNLGWITQTTITGLRFSSGSVAEYFNYQSGLNGGYQISAAGVIIQVWSSRGKLVAQGINHVSLPSARASTSYHLRLRSATGGPTPSYSLTISVRPMVAAARKFTRPKGR